MKNKEESLKVFLCEMCLWDCPFWKSRRELLDGFLRLLTVNQLLKFISVNRV